MEIFLLWHVRHAPFVDGRPTRHRGESGELVWDEEEGDSLKILGAYSTEQRAQEGIARARLLPGFRDEPDCFLIDRYTIDDDRWTDGFVAMPAGEQKPSRPRPENLRRLGAGRETPHA